MRLIAFQLVLGAGNFVRRVLDGGLILLQLRLELRNFQDGHQLPRLHAAAIVDAAVF